ncbi:hypothetical protein DPEC_G00242490 [Dallia pectoralis]|uniref:Uncharacterized protein n=1 Tax=Dallia pectoralis TaxID=75939 RepID=A0ACC2FV88_DALPE|nr:hypothetical protein DPEC_G00242490 [Dallia pectoralis]
MFRNITAVFLGLTRRERKRNGKAVGSLNHGNPAPRLPLGRLLLLSPIEDTGLLLEQKTAGRKQLEEGYQEVDRQAPRVSAVGRPFPHYTRTSAGFPGCHTRRRGLTCCSPVLQRLVF